MRKPLSFEPSRLKLGSETEVHVGAYARRQVRRRVLMGVFGALLIAGAVALYYPLSPRAVTGVPERYSVRVRCAACGGVETLEVPFSQTFPMECSACKELACRPLWRCRDCGAEFVGGRSGTIVHCPRCGGQRVGSALAP